MEDVAKLPKWAQERMRQLEFQRNAAIRALQEFENKQTESRVWVADHACIGETPGPSLIKNYLQTRNVTFKVGEDEISCYLREDNILDINSHYDSISIRPQAANSIHIIGKTEAKQFK